MRPCAIILACLLPFLALSQKVKNEIEKRIKEIEMPAPAVEMLKKMQIGSQVRYYLEKDGDTRSYEAKFKQEGHLYSVEFTPGGKLEDVEVTIAFKALPAPVKDAVLSDLASRSARFKVEKTQLHYDARHWENALKKEGPPDGHELIVALKNEKNKLSKQEMTYDASGKFLSSRKVVRRSYDFMLF
ncbi:MAG: hypothetical protein CL868_12440 [Cytophagaceae bacterium]|nr:hypothetical protein [Cytophagaceae bacterium]|tara:strand:+ start:1242 stop:1799 length:558 start_codon:yes stop_codon:yes gene_type:complete